MLKLKIYCAGERYNERGHTVHPSNFTIVPKSLCALVKSVEKEMRKRNPICCLKMQIDEEQREVVASTCSEYFEETVRFGFAKIAKKIKLTELPPKNLLEEMQKHIARSFPIAHEPIVKDKYVDEEKGVAIFILREILEKGVLGVTGPRGIQVRYTLYKLKKGQALKVLYSDHAYSGTPRYSGRECNLYDMKIIGNKVVVCHNKSTTYSNDASDIEELIFDI